jgi:hypothetical protein
MTEAIFDRLVNVAEDFKIQETPSVEVLFHQHAYFSIVINENNLNLDGIFHFSTILCLSKITAL